MRIRVLYEVTVDGVKYMPGIVEVRPGVGLRLLEEHRGNFEAVKERPAKKPVAQEEEPKEE